MFPATRVVTGLRVSTRRVFTPALMQTRMASGTSTPSSSTMEGLKQQPKEVAEEEYKKQTSSDSMSKTHAKNDGEDSIVPKKIQEVVPESVERALPNKIHNTGDK